MTSTSTSTPISTMRSATLRGHLARILADQGIHASRLDKFLLWESGYLNLRGGRFTLTDAGRALCDTP